MGICSVLNVIRDKELPVIFHSRQFNGAITELESLAIVDSVYHFKLYLHGRSLKVAMDHKPCCALMSGSHINMGRRCWMQSPRIVNSPGGGEGGGGGGGGGEDMLDQPPAQEENTEE